ncbi:hypothetical protein [Lysinibacillus sp. 54212]|uniref:hypothetical protein n=1 Tax=Lysinibacillus sp. 54212 TaxID=3119829 RepID=UPI002FC5D022
MRKTMYVVVMMTFISVVLSGCQSYATKLEQQTEPIAKTYQQSVGNDNIILDGEISLVTILNLQDNNKIVFNEDNNLGSVNNIIVHAEKQPGIVDMVSPEYRVNVTFTDGKESTFNLWLGEKGMKSTLMKTEESHTIYTVSEEMTDQLSYLIEM